MVGEWTTAADNLLVDLADIVLTLVDLKMFGFASFYSETFFLFDIQMTVHRDIYFYDKTKEMH